MPSRRSLFKLPPFRAAPAALAAAAAALLALAGCHRVVSDPQDPRFIVAEEPKAWAITRAELTAQVNLFLQQAHRTPQDIGPAKMPQLESRILRGMVLKRLLLDRAAQLHIPDADLDRETAALLAEVKGHFPSEQEFEAKIQAAGLTLDEFKKGLRESILIRKALEADAIRDADPTEQEINDFYLKNPDKFVVPQKVRASRVVIMVDEKTSPADRAARKKAIDQARARVVKGEDFGKVAEEVSEDRYSAPKGGDVGYFQRGENEDNFDAVAFSMKPGVVSPVFETPMGYQFLKVTDVQPGGELSIAQVRDVIARHLREEKVLQEENDYTRALPEKSGVIFHLVEVDLAPTPGVASQPAETNAPASPPAGTP